MNVTVNAPVAGSNVTVSNANVEPSDRVGCWPAAATHSSAPTPLPRLGWAATSASHWVCDISGQVPFGRVSVSTMSSLAAYSEASRSRE